MRTGEVFALNWNDIELDNRIIKINKTVYVKDREENGRWYLGTTKTIGSSREVYICDTLYSVLYDYKKLQVKYKKAYGKKYKRYILKEVKIEVADSVCKFIKNVQDKFYEYRNDEKKLKEILTSGANKARIYASKKMNFVKEKVGLNI